MNFLAKFLATGFGTGYSPVAPGTIGTAVGFLLYVFLSPLSWPMYGLTMTVFLFIAVWITNWALPLFGSEDPSFVVIDEMAGALFTMAFFPLDIVTLVAGFFFFRLFDIFKPFPSGWAENNLPGGWGVVMDDVFAGIYANLCLHLLGFFGVWNWFHAWIG